MSNLRDRYIGVDPIIEDLVSTVISLEAHILDLESKLRSISNPVKEDVTYNKPQKIRDLIVIFEQRYEATFGEPYPLEYQDYHYPTGRAKQFMQTMNLSLLDMGKFLKYLFTEDPRLQAGIRPQVRDLFNRQVLASFKSHKSKSSSSKKITMSTDDMDMLEKLGRG